MVYCPVCKTEVEDDSTSCPICGNDFEKTGEVSWVVVGEIEDKISADFAREALKSYDIPAVIFSRSGFFGRVGLPVYPI